MLATLLLELDCPPACRRKVVHVVDYQSIGGGRMLNSCHCIRSLSAIFAIFFEICKPAPKNLQARGNISSRGLSSRCPASVTGHSALPSITFGSKLRA